ncbi:hypothetical protein MOQ72_43550 [Saccharopolyspora sp. K220]|uniref:hypothetical protein n=1 Tax=Saccharopolyspora soli TaxID=2926618 RepID=UPI001F5AAC27|nr:hypothetical protein [Saccharopolyspora soli]MCI2424290.1 hypothetical protein [Saccharopolyspora soli]
MDELEQAIVLPGEAELRARLATADNVDPHLAEKTFPEIVAQLQGQTKHPMGVVNTIVVCLESYRQSTGLPVAVEPALMGNVPPLLAAIASSDEEKKQLSAQWARVQQLL